jgi:hypothetical protein
MEVRIALGKFPIGHFIAHWVLRFGKYGLFKKGSQKISEKYTTIAISIFFYLSLLTMVLNWVRVKSNYPKIAERARTNGILKRRSSCLLSALTSYFKAAFSVSSGSRGSVTPV